MKIKSIEKFRNELYKNLKELWFGAEYTIYEASKCMFKNENLKPENRNRLGCRSLENVLVIQKSHRDENFKQIIDDELLIIMNPDIAVVMINMTEKKDIKSGSQKQGN